MARRKFPRNRDFDEFEKIDVEPQDEGAGPEGLHLSPEMQSKLSGVKKGSLSLLKLILGLVFLTFVYSSTLAFIEEFKNVGPKFQKPFWDGLIAFVLFYFFVWEPVKLYQRGQKILEAIFRFMAPLVKVAPYVLPIYTILLFCLYPLVNLVFPDDRTLVYFMFMIGFSIALHLVFGAKALRTKQGDFLKANYLFGFTLVYIINIVLLGLMLNLVFSKFSFVNFFNAAYMISHDMAVATFRQIFVLN
ncbi:MAG: hypothetical protein PHS64_00490 [Candidatus Omnitrophica bacterium]|nr:hypothetical protein [Candidatus Omnitrophota bacterium]